MHAANHATDKPHAAALVRQAAADLGFAIVGIAPAAASERKAFVQQWIDEGKHGEMHYLANHLEKRVDPTRLLPNAQSVIVVADRYHAQLPEDQASPGSPAVTDDAHTPPAAQGRIARYAWGNDYHKVIKKRLFDLADQLRDAHPEHEFKVTVDTAPTLEREHATRAGLGWIGKHTLLIHPQLGSWLLLGTIITTLRLDDSTANAADRDATPPTRDDRPSDALTMFADRLINDHCGTCTRCIQACPTQCITPYQVDGSRCISYLTLEHRSAIDPEMHGQMGSWIAGCDVCQEVCPHNRERPTTPPKSANPPSGDPPVESRWRKPLPPVVDDYEPRFPAPAVDLLEVLNWTIEDRQHAFTKSALKRVKLPQLKRNALIAAGNAIIAGDLLDDSHRTALLDAIKRLAEDKGEDELVRETAKQTLARLDESKG